MTAERKTFASDFRRFFLRGLAILLPSVLTLWIVVQAYFFVERQVAEPINRGIRSAVLWTMPKALPERRMPAWFVVTPEEVRRYREMLARQSTLEAQALQRQSDQDLRQVIRAAEFKRFWDDHWYFRFIGLIVAITLIYLAGVLLGGFLGRHVYQRLEGFFTRIPVFKQVYPHVKQVVDMVLGERSVAFHRVVMVEYPRRGIWTLGFVTGMGMKEMRSRSGEDVLSVFIPSTPTPFTGFTIAVPRSAAIDVPITVDEAIRYVLTGGVLVPSRQSTEGLGALVPPPAEPRVAEAPADERTTG